jgi:hypothetical protein
MNITPVHPSHERLEAAEVIALAALRSSSARPAFLAPLDF